MESQALQMSVRARRKSLFSKLFDVDMRTGSPICKILIFCIPLFIVNFLNIFTTSIVTLLYDNFVGNDAFYIPSLIGNAVSYIGSIVGGIVNASMIYIARARGAGKKTRERRLLIGAVYSVVIADIVVGGVFLAGYRAVFAILNIPAEVYSSVFRYYFLYIVTYIFTAFSTLIVSVLMGVSGLAQIFAVNALTTCFPVAVLYIVLAVFELGMDGVATYAAINSCFVVAVGLFCLRKYRYLRPKWRELVPDFKIIRKIVGYGLLLSLQSIFCSIGYLCASASTNKHLSALFISTAGVTLPVSAPLTSFSSAISVFCAQNYGAKNFERVREGIMQTLCVAEVYALLCMVFYIFFAPVYWNVTFSDPEFIRLGIERWQASSVGFVFVGVLYVLRFGLDSIGCGKFTVFAGVAEFLVQLLCAFVLIPAIGNFASAAAQALDWGLSAVYLICLYAFLYKRILPIRYDGARRLRRALRRRARERLNIFVAL